MKLSKLAVFSLLAAGIILLGSYFLYEPFLEKAIYYAAKRHFKEHFNANFSADISTNSGNILFENIIITSKDSQDPFYFKAHTANVVPTIALTNRRLDLLVKIDGLALSIVQKQKWIAEGLIKKTRSPRWFEMAIDFEAVDSEIISSAENGKPPLSFCFDVKGSMREETSFELKCWSNRAEKTQQNLPNTHLQARFKKNHVDFLDVSFESLGLKECEALALMAGIEQALYLQVSKGTLNGRWHYDAALNSIKLPYGSGNITVHGLKVRLPALPVNLTADEIELLAEEETGGIALAVKRGGKVFRDLEIPFNEDYEKTFLAKKHATIRPFTLSFGSDGAIRSDLHVDFLPAKGLDFTKLTDTTHQATLQIRGKADRDKLSFNYSCKTCLYTNALLAGELILKGAGGNEKLNERMLDLSFKGDADKLASWFPKKIYGAIANRLKLYQISIEGHLTPFGKNWKGHGECCLINPNSGSKEKIDFTANLVRVFPNDFSDYFVTEGQFHGQKLTLDHFITPLLFPDEEISLKGMADIAGTFNDKGIVVRYRPDNVEVDNEGFYISFHDETTSVDKYSGIHTYEFKGDKQYGCLKVKDGLYIEKNTELAFSNINTTIQFGEKRFDCNDLESLCEGIYFAGALHMDYSSPLKKTFDLSLEIPTMFGTVTQYQQLLCKLDIPTPLRKADLRGVISHEAAPSYLKFAFKPHDFDFEGRIRGRLQEGICQALEGKACLQDIALIFDYQHLQKSLQLEAIQGVLTVPGIGIEREWALTEGAVHLKGIGKTRGDFIFSFDEEGKDFACLAGEFKPLNSKTEDGRIQFQLDLDKTHIHGEPLREFELIVDSWEDVDNLKWHSKIDLNLLCGYLQAACRSGIASVPSIVMESLDVESGPDSTTGKLEFAIDYDRSTALFNIHAESLIENGTGVKLGGRPFEKIALDAKKRHQTWMIEQLVLDDFSAAADLEHDEDGWKVNFFGARLADLGLLGVEGVFLPDSCRFEGKVNLLEIDFSKANTVKSPTPLAWIKPLLDHDVKGELKAHGEIQAAIASDSPLSLEILLNVNTKSIFSSGCALQDIQNMSCHFHSQGLGNSRLTVRNLKTALMTMSKDAVNTVLLIEKGEYDSSTKKLSLQNCQFTCPVERLPWSLERIGEYFPNALTEEGKSFALSLKKEGALSGSLDCMVGQGPLDIEFNMSPGTYFFGGKPYHFDEANFKLKQRQWFGIARLKVEKLPCFAILEELGPVGSDWRGRLVLTEIDPKEHQPLDTANALFFECLKQPSQELKVERVIGNLSGLSLNCVHVDRENHFYPCHQFNGSASLLFPEVSRLLPQDKLEVVEALALSGFWDFTGDFLLPKENDREADILFTGQVTGKNYSIKGIEGDSAFAYLMQEPKAVHLSSVEFQDRSYLFQIPECRIYCNEGDNEFWFFAFEKAALSNVEPSIIRFTDGSDFQAKRSIYFPKIELQNFSGALSYPETYQGSGQLLFAKHTRKNLQNTVLALPAEIISRLGLNPNALSPVSGSVLFTVGNRKIYLNRFKDVYSEGKLSKFYLSSSSPASTIDFDGNLDLYVRMKHYNLLFKLSDLFTVTVGGTVQKPTYYLNRNGKKK